MWSRFINPVQQEAIIMNHTPPKSALYNHVEQAVHDYLHNLAGENTTNMYELFLHELEKPLLISLLKHTNHNQSKTAKMLGLNRGTLRAKMKTHGLLW